MLAPSSSVVTVSQGFDANPQAGAREDAGVAFDRMVVTHILEKALAERDERGGRLADRVGLPGTALGILLMLHIPAHPVLGPDDYQLSEEECEEQGWVRDLLARSCTDERELSRWLAAMVARRAMEASHLWEDLGLPNRDMLSALLLRHFEPLASENTNGMRWKRFFFRTLCEEEGLSHCTSPTCSECVDVDRCFEPESAERMIAMSKKAPT